MYENHMRRLQSQDLIKIGLHYEELPSTYLCDHLQNRQGVEDIQYQSGRQHPCLNTESI